MRRQDIQLLTLARQGDPAARSKAGRRYLVGGDGFPRHVATGIEYLSHPSVRELPETACAIAESLPLQDLLDLKQEDALHKAAAAGSPLAQFKLGVWMALTRSSVTAGQSWLETAAAAGHVEACQVMAAVEGARSDRALEAMVESIQSSAAVDVVQVAVIAARLAREEGGLDQLVDCLRVALMVAPRLTHALSDLVVAAVLWAEREKHSLRGLAPDQIEASLELAVVRGDRDAACLLGRARCGIDSGTLAPARLATSLNLRKGVALLLRAADAGRDDAWLALYATHADHRSSVSNPQMARFFLEKAAMAGQSEAQRKLGALILRASSSVVESEQAIAWLHAAANQGDAHAQRLLGSLVLPLQGSESVAREAIEQVRQADPWLAVRLTLARDFGLTKLEALSVDPVEGRRPWGLLVGQNPFIAQARLSAPRAVPALTPLALQNLARAAALFEQSRGDGNAFEGDLRRRSVRQRRVFERLHLSEDLFFATASSRRLEAFRLGPKWAFRARQPLALALAG
jgi:TPR repeat protein